MNIIWIKKGLSEWVSIDLDKIRTFRYDLMGTKEVKYLYINNELVAVDRELILFKALKQYLTDSGSNVSLSDAVERYNAKRGN